MFRNSGSAPKPRFATPRLLGITMIIALASAFAALGCGSSDNTAPTTCDIAGVETMFSAKGCTLGGCHDSAGSAAGLSLLQPGLADRLLGKSPVANMGLTPSMCAGQGKVYLNANSNPATGLLIDKVDGTATCGVRMPIGGMLNASEISCLRTWATTVTSP